MTTKEMTRQRGLSPACGHLRRMSGVKPDLHGADGFVEDGEDEVGAGLR
jgi:hypothetical protein